MKEIQSVEVACLVHSTEDEDKVASSITKRLKISGKPQKERLRGHFGNDVVYITYQLTGEEAASAFHSIVEETERDSLRNLLDNIGSAIDEHSALHLRFGKQELVRGRLVVSNSDPIKVRVKPKSFLVRGDASEFYTRHFRQGE